MSQEPIQVAAAVIIHQNKVLLARRDGGHLDNLWEFPGGKLEANESAATAARRELFEELEIGIIACDTLLSLEHQYPDKKVCLHFVSCTLEEDEGLYKTIKNPRVGWFKPNQFPFEEFCPADKIAAHRLPWEKLFKVRKINE